jgi:hypothetical protein
MIELTEGRCVKWESNGWHTGRVLGPEILECAYGIKTVLLVRDTCTSRVFAVEAGQLLDNDFRKDERKAEGTNES